MYSVNSAILVALVLACTATATNTLFPNYSWDSHMHIFDPERFPLSPDRDYTPKAATISNATEFQKALGIRISLSYSQASKFHAAGVRGIRLSMIEGTNEKIVAAVYDYAAVARVHSWVLQIRVPLKAFVALHEVIPNLGVRVVVDHFAFAQVGSKTNNTRDSIDPYQKVGFPEVIDLMRRKLLFVKISGPYLMSNMAPSYEDTQVLTETFMINGPDMVVYGSDWPHTANKEGNAAVGGKLNPADFRKIDDVQIVNMYKEWVGSEAQFRRLFQDNPRRLWQWEEFNS